MPVAESFIPRTDYSMLAPGFSDSVKPASFPKLQLRFWNQRWAQRLGLGDLTAAEREHHFAKFVSLPGTHPEPLAMRYHGHQFRHYNPNLGDGRGFLFAQCEDPVDHRCLDFGTKGSGQTPYSRAGDGRLTLKGAVREALATEMLESLGVRTSKTFCFFETGEALERNDEPSPTRAAVLTRLSHGHIRFGTFQRFAALGETENIEKLLDYSLRTYWPELRFSEDLRERTIQFLDLVVEGSARMCAQWMMAGFVHGVLNTDNMNITGESFDYGPWRFLPFYDPSFTAAYFDHEGLYSYARQPEAVYWNLDQLARALFAMAPAESVGDAELWQAGFVESLERYPGTFRKLLLESFFVRLGLVADLGTSPVSPQGSLLKIEQAETVFTAVFSHLRETKCLFEKFFFEWYGGSKRRQVDNGSAAASTTDLVSTEIHFKNVLDQGFREGWLSIAPETASILKEVDRTGFQPPSILIDEVEAIWTAIDKNDDWSQFHSKIESFRERGRIYGFELG